MAALAIACGGGRDQQARRDSTVAGPASPATHAIPPESISPARDSSFAWFAGRALSELRDSVTLAMWLAGHRNDTLPREDGPWCAQAVTMQELEDDRIAVRRAYFYQPVPSEARPAIPDRPDIARDCVLGRIVVLLEADTREDSLLSGVDLELRRLFDRPQRPRSYEYGAERPRPFEDDQPGDSIIAWGRLPRSDDADRVAASLGEFPEAGLRDTAFVQHFLRQRADCGTVNLDSLIEVGEALLPGTRDTPLAMTMHYMIADALADQLLDANPTTRASAIEHYRAAIRLESTPPSSHYRRAHWTMWRLLAGLKPANAVYIYECGD